MLTRPLGRSGLDVSVLGLGAGHLDIADLSDRDAESLLDHALALGVTFVDTARGYGASEERLGRWLPAHREQVVVSTKVGYDVPGHDDWTAGAVTGGVERALRVLRTDVVDVVFLHSCPLEVLLRGEVVDALLACRDAGTVRLPGYSGENDELAWAAQAGVFDVLQTSVNLADQRSTREVLAGAARCGLGGVAKRPIANAAWRHAERPVGVYGETYWERLRAMGLTPEADDWAGTAIRFAAFSPGVDTAILGTSSRDNLSAAAAAVGRGPLPAGERSRWDAAFDVRAGESPGDWLGEV
ncbi:MAG: aldo/keto reductase [Nocardioides sp.]